MTLHNAFWYAGAFIVALGILVVFHELGHYLAARLCDVKVLRFSVGFGRSLWSRKLGRDGTEWSIGAFPLGGYVKMLDEREGQVAAAELPRAFNRQPVARRAFIVAAGPVANLLLAIGLYWVIFVHGVEELRPILAAPPAATAAAAAGIPERGIVRAINDVPVRSWQDVRWEVMRRALDRERIRIGVMADGTTRDFEIDGGAIDLADVDSDPLRPLGLLLHRPALPAVVGEVVPASAAEIAGLSTGDAVLAIDGQPVADWNALARVTRGAPGKALRLEVRRDGRNLELIATPAAANEGGATVGRLGIRVREDDALHASRFLTVRYGPFAALGKAVTQTWDTSVLSLRMIGRMLIGEVSWKNISGPVTIADYAGQSARLGLTQYLRFLALISISLGVLNLLPIPVLDGGHLMYYLVEVIKGRPLSERVMEYGQQVGLALLALLMAFAFYNDINRLISG